MLSLVNISCSWNPLQILLKGNNLLIEIKFLTQVSASRTFLNPSQSGPNPYLFKALYSWKMDSNKCEFTTITFMVIITIESVGGLLNNQLPLVGTR